MNRIQELVLQKNWRELMSSCSVKEVCSSLTFSQAMHAVGDLFCDDIRDDDKLQYALRLAFEVKEYFQEEWDDDWKHDVFLGGLCGVLCLFEEEYYCYKRAYDRQKDPSAELLIRLSNCHSTPDSSFVSDEEYESYILRAAAKKMTSETASAMRSLFRLKKDIQQEEYWDKMCKKLERENVRFEFIVPDVFQKK